MQIKQMVWQREGFYTFGNGIFYNDKFYNADEYGIVRLPELGNYYLLSLSKLSHRTSTCRRWRRYQWVSLPGFPLYRLLSVPRSAKRNRSLTTTPLLKRLR